MKRRLFNLAAAVSLVLCVPVSLASAVLEFTTFRWTHEFDYYGRDHFLALYMTHGSARLFISPAQREVRVWKFSTVDAQATSGNRLGFRFESRDNLTLVGIPLWLISVVSGCCGWMLWRRRRVSRQGLCPSCGYDLRATPDRCPECGAEAKPQPAEGAAA